MSSIQDNLHKIINKYRIRHKYTLGGKSSILLPKLFGGITQGEYTLIAGLKSSAKRSFLDYFYVSLLTKQWFNLDDDIREQRPLKIIYFSTKYTREQKILKWMSTMYTSSFRSAMDLPTMLQGPGRLFNMDDNMEANLESIASIFDEMVDNKVLEIIDGKISPLTIETKMEEILSEYGEISYDKEGLQFIPEEGFDNTLFMIIVDDINEIHPVGVDDDSSKPFMVRAHLDRLFKSYARLGLNPTVSITSGWSGFGEYSADISELKNLSPDKAIVMSNPRVGTNRKSSIGFVHEEYIGEDSNIFRLRFANIIYNSHGPANIAIPFVVSLESGIFVELKKADHPKADVFNPKMMAACEKWRVNQI